MNESQKAVIEKQKLQIKSNEEKIKKIEDSVEEHKILITNLKSRNQDYEYEISQYMEVLREKDEKIIEKYKVLEKMIKGKDQQIDSDKQNLMKLGISGEGEKLIIQSNDSGLETDCEIIDSDDSFDQDLINKELGQVSSSKSSKSATRWWSGMATFFWTIF